MLDPNLLKENIEILEKNIKRRGLDIDLDNLIKLNEERKSARFDAEQKRSEQKEMGKQIANSSKEEKEELLKQASALSDEVKSLFEIVEKKTKIFLICGLSYQI